MKNLLVILSLVLSGCATVNEIRGPNGSRAFSITCRRSIDVCYSEASKLCPGGWNILNSSQKTKGYAKMGGMVHQISDENILVECTGQSAATNEEQKKEPRKTMF